MVLHVRRRVPVRREARPVRDVERLGGDHGGRDARARPASAPAPGRSRSRRRSRRRWRAHPELLQVRTAPPPGAGPADAQGVRRGHAQRACERPEPPAAGPATRDIRAWPSSSVRVAVRVGLEQLAMLADERLEALLERLPWSRERRAPPVRVSRIGHLGQPLDRADGVQAQEQVGHLPRRGCPGRSRPGRPAARGPPPACACSCASGPGARLQAEMVAPRMGRREAASSTRPPGPNDLDAGHHGDWRRSVERSSAASERSAMSGSSTLSSSRKVT